MEGQIIVSRMERNSKKYKRKNRNKIRNKDNSSIYLYEMNPVECSDVLEFPVGMTRRSKRNKERRIALDKKNKITNALGASLMGATIIYCGTELYFKNHFLPNTKINGADISFKSIDEASESLNKNMKNYNLKIRCRDGVTEDIAAKDINLQYDFQYDYELEKLKNNQSSAFWISSLFKENDVYKAKIVSYDESLLNEVLNNLSIFDDSQVIEPQDAYLKFDGDKFVIADEIYGSKVNKDKFNNAIVQALVNSDKEINLETFDCYEKPDITSSSEKLVNACNKINEYCDFTLTYNIGEEEYVLSQDDLLGFFVFDEDYNMSIDNTKIESFVDKLCEKYNTKGKSRKFTTSKNEIISISKGDYGRVINKQAEISKIIEDISNKQRVNREPVYSQVSFNKEVNDIGNTYVEIDMSRQHLWFYKSGNLICDGDIVTGNINQGRGTPDGVYSLKYKLRNTVLIGRDYSSPVSYWMPFNNNIGLHDASWRSVFGKDFYKTNGSHGCVNAPYMLAKSIYENIENGTPIVCHY